eukprot:188182_1
MQIIMLKNTICILVIMTWTSFAGLLWGTSVDKTLFTVDVDTKEYNTIATEFTGLESAVELVYDCINKKMYVSEGGCESTTGCVVIEMDMSGNVVGSSNVGGMYLGLEYADGILYGWNFQGPVSDGLKILDPTTGTALSIPSYYYTGYRDNFGQVKPIGALAYMLETNTMYG